MYIEWASFIIESSFRDTGVLQRIKTVLRIIREIESESNPKWIQVKRNDCEVRCEGINWLVNNPTVYYFKCKVGDIVLFLKHSHCVSHIGSWGKKEAKSNVEAQKRLDESGINWVVIIDAKLGYTRRNEMFFISEWTQIEWLQVLSDILKEKDIVVEKTKRLKYKFNTLKELFKDFYDFSEDNILVDVKTEKFYLFDLYQWQ